MTLPVFGLMLCWYLPMLTPATARANRGAEFIGQTVNLGAVLIKTLLLVYELLACAGAGEVAAGDGAVAGELAGAGLGAGLVLGELSD